MRNLTVSRMWNNKLYCWPCLLFSNEYEVGNKQGFLHINHFSSSQQRQSKSQSYAHCYLQLKVFIKQQRVDLLFDAQCRNDVTKPNEQVKKDRIIFRRFIGVVCSLVYQKLPFPGPWWVVHVFWQRKFRGICQCVEKSCPSSWKSVDSDTRI
jgi:hypothetical protein